MDDILITNYQRKYDHKSKYKSIDICFISNTVLNCPENFTDTTLKRGNEEEINDDKKTLKIFKRNREENFWVVFHHILEKDDPYIKEAIKYSINH